LPALRGLATLQCRRAADDISGHGDHTDSRHHNEFSESEFSVNTIRPTQSSAATADGAPSRQPTRAERITQRLTAWLADHSIAILRVSLGLVFLMFGILKFVPGASPAEELAVRTVQTLSLGMLPAQAAVLLTAVIETFIGLTLVSGRLLRTGLTVMAVALVGIMSPLVLFAADLFPGAPTLEAQYVLKDIVLVAAGLVIAATALGARLRAVPLRHPR
jgi:putative oxidoreductase